MTRQDFLRGALALTAVPLLRPIPAFAAAPSPDSVEVSEIAPGVFVHQGRYEMQSPENEGDMANAGIVVGSDAVAVIDTLGSFKVGERLRNAVRAVTDKPIRYVINTHMHPDHVFGNAAFKEDAPAFVANHKLARGLASRAERYLATNKRLLGDDAFAGIEVVLPTVPVDNTMSLDLGGRTLLLETQRTAHTDNDLIVTDSATGTLFLGDLLFSVHVPTLDGSIVGWLAVIDDLKKRNAPTRRPRPRSSRHEAAGGVRSRAALSRRYRRRRAQIDQGRQDLGGSDQDRWLRGPRRLEAVR